MCSTLSQILQEYTGQILDNPLFADGQQKEKMIQVFDLCHFIDCYGRPLKVIDYSQHKINIVEDEGVQKGIYFCDLVYDTKYVVEWPLFIPSKVETLRCQFKIKELWFVIVEESLSTENLKGSEQFVDMHKVADLYDKIFYFNFSQSTIRILK